MIKRKVANLFVLEVTVKDYLACKDLIEFVNSAAPGMPEISAEIDALSKADHELREFLRSLPKHHPINLDSEERRDSDMLAEGTSSFEQLRRKQAKELARRLIRATHPDVNPDGPDLGITFEQIRSLSKEGEVEVLQYLRKKAGFSVNGDDSDEDKQVDQLNFAAEALYVRLKRLKATPGFKLATLYYANRAAFVENAKLIFARKANELSMQLTEMIYPKGSADAREELELADTSTVNAMPMQHSVHISSAGLAAQITQLNQQEI